MTAVQLQEAFSQLDQSQQVEFLKALMPTAMGMMRSNPIAMLEIMAACQEQMAGMDMGQLMGMFMGVGSKESGCCSSAGGSSSGCCS